MSGASHRITIEIRAKDGQQIFRLRHCRCRKRRPALDSVADQAAWLSFARHRSSHPERRAGFVLLQSAMIAA